MPSDYTIYDTDNYPENPAIDGYRGFMPRASAVGYLEGVPLFCESFKLIPKERWKEEAEAFEAAKAYVRYRYELMEPVAKNQGRLSFCWAFSLAQTIEAARACTGLPYVELAPETLGELTRWSNAGYYCDKALAYAIKNGIASRQFAPNLSIDPRTYKPGWKEDALKHCPLEYYDLGGNDLWAECVTALLSGFSIYVGYNWWSHAVMIDWLTFVNGELCLSGPNSWGPGQRFVLKGSKKYPNEAFAIRSCTYSAS